MNSRGGVIDNSLASNILAIVADIGMDKERLDKLIDAADDQDKITMKVLYNAVVSNLTAYNAQKSSSRLKDWHHAQTALTKSIAEMEGKYFPSERPLPNLLAVVDWMKDHGWKVSKSKLYADAKVGKIASKDDGTYSIKSIQTYAGNYLRQKGVIGKREEALGDIASLKAQAEADKLRSQADMAAINLKIKQGRFVEKDYLDQELARRAALFKNDLITFCRTSAVEIISLVSGDPDRVPDLIDHMIETMESCLNRYAEDREFKVPDYLPDYEKPTKDNEGEDDDED